jgi:di/tricarboxylate transporter
MIRQILKKLVESDMTKWIEFMGVMKILILLLFPMILYIISDGDELKKKIRIIKKEKKFY